MEWKRLKDQINSTGSGTHGHFHAGNGRNLGDIVARQARDVNARGYVSKCELSQSLLPIIRRLIEEKRAALSERELGLQ